MNKVYTLRALEGDDLFLMLKIIKKIGIKEIKRCFESEAVMQAVSAMANQKKVKDVESVGITVALEVVDILASNIPECRDELYQLLSSLSGMKVEEIGKLPMLTMLSMVKDVIMAKEFTDFFPQLFGSRETAT